MKKRNTKHHLPEDLGRLFKAKLHLENLEERAQPGSILSLGGAVLSGAALEANANLADTSVSSSASSMQIIMHSANDDHVASHHGANLTTARQLVSAPSHTAAASTGHVAAPATSQDLSLQQQERAASSFVAQAGTVVAHSSVTATAAPNTASQGGSIVASGAIGTTTTPAVNQSIALAPVQAHTSVGVNHIQASASVAVAGSALHLQSAQDIAVVHPGNVPPPGGSGNNPYTTYFGTADGQSHLNAIRAEPYNGVTDGQAVVGGDITDASSGISDGVVALLAADGSAVLGATGITDPNGVVAWTAKSVDIDPADNAIYVAFNGTATDGSGTTLFAIGRVAPDLSGLDWAETLVDGSGNPINGAINSVRVSNGSLYFTGAFVDPNNPLVQDLPAVRFDNLGPDPSQLTLTGNIWSFSDPTTGNQVSAVGNGIAADSQGQAYVAGSVSNATLDDTSALTFVVGGAALDTVQDAFTITGNQDQTMPNKGAYVSVDVDSQDVAYMVGTTHIDQDNMGQPIDQNAFTISRFQTSGGTTSFLYTNPATGMPIVGWLYYYPASPSNPAFDGFAVSNRAVGNGEQAVYVQGVPTIPPTEAFAAGYIFTSNGDATTSMAADGFGPFGANDDRAEGMDVVVTDLGPDVYLAGSTDSPDFNTTSGAFQEMAPCPTDPDHGNPCYNGYAAKVQLAPQP